MKTGGSPSALKEMNRRQLLRLLSREKLSCSDLARRSGLSYTGVVTLVEELVREGVLLKSEAETTSLGRRPNLLEISPRFGVVCVVNFNAASVITMAFYSLGGEQLEHGSVLAGQIKSRDDIDRTVAKIKEILESKIPSVKLLHIALAVPGKVDKATSNFVYAPFFENYAETNLKEIFEAGLDAPVTVKNDVRFSLIAEKNYGDHREDIRNTLYLQIGVGFGCALCLDNELCEGSRGHNGEIGLFVVNSVLSDDLIHRNVTYQQICSYDNVLAVCREAVDSGAETCLKHCGEITVEAVNEGFLEGDGLCERIVRSFITVTANMIKSLAVAVDFNNVILARQNLRFGDRFIEELERTVNTGAAYSPIAIYKSTLGKESVVLGAKRFAIDRVIENF